MLEILPKLFLYKLFRKFDFPRIFPINLTISITNKCNSHCLTCNIWKNDKKEKLSLSEFEKIFKTMGKAYWITISGGEPFLRDDLIDICILINKYLTPKVLNIPSNGILKDIIPNKMEEIIKIFKNSKVIFNLSLDGVGKKHDEIRGVKDNFSFAMKTYEDLKKLSYKNFFLGVGTVISKFNVSNFSEILNFINEIKPDSFVCEIAERRVELNTDDEIIPEREEYFKAIDLLSSNIKDKKFSLLPSIIQSFRLVYYDLTKKIVQEETQVIPCFAGFASCQIMPDGEVVACCVDGDSFGNLRENDYNFKKIWNSENAKIVREKIKKNTCFCPLANVSYTNILLDYKSLFKVFKEAFYFA